MNGMVNMAGRGTEKPGLGREAILLRTRHCHCLSSHCCVASRAVPNPQLCIEISPGIPPNKHGNGHGSIELVKFSPCLEPEVYALSLQENNMNYVELY
jgi:hypothetical protein